MTPLVRFSLISVGDSQEALALKALAIVYEHGVAKANFDEQVQNINKKKMEIDSELGSVEKKDSDLWREIKIKKDKLEATLCEVEAKWTESVADFESRYLKIDSIVGYKLKDAEKTISKAAEKGIKF